VNYVHPHCLRYIEVIVDALGSGLSGKFPSALLVELDKRDVARVRIIRTWS
jgi:hypothetical protein